MTFSMQHATEAGLAGRVDAPVGGHGHDACRWHGREARLVGHSKQLHAFVRAQSMAWHSAHGCGPAIAHFEPFVDLPSLQGAQLDAGGLAGQLQPRACGVCDVDVSGQGSAIFEADRSASPLLKITATLFDSTKSAAVSARARSLRNRSRSSSLMRLVDARVACRLARASSGAASAAVQLARHWSSSAGYTPCSRHHALLPASLMAAVVIMASSRAPAVQARPREGLDCASSRQRSSVPAPMPTSRATSSNAALSGGSNLATALSLNARPYRANSILHRRPRVLGSIGATTILTREEPRTCGITQSKIFAAPPHTDEFKWQRQTSFSMQAVPPARGRQEKQCRARGRLGRSIRQCPPFR